MAKKKIIIEPDPILRKKSIKLEKIKDTTSQELVFKTKPEWIKSSLASKSQYQNKYKEF